MNILDTVLRAPARFAVKQAEGGSTRGWFDGLPGERIAIRVSSANTRGAYTLMESLAAPGSAVPLHKHGADEAFLILGGTMTFRVGERTFSAKAGASVIIPGGTPHCWKNQGPVPVHSVVVFAPGNLEGLFRRLAATPPERIERLAAEYDTTVVGPPLD